MWYSLFESWIAYLDSLEYVNMHNTFQCHVRYIFICILSTLTTRWIYELIWSNCSNTPLNLILCIGWQTLTLTYYLNIISAFLVFSKLYEICSQTECSLLCSHMKVHFISSSVEAIVWSDSNHNLIVRARRVLLVGRRAREFGTTQTKWRTGS